MLTIKFSAFKSWLILPLIWVPATTAAEQSTSTPTAEQKPQANPAKVNAEAKTPLSMTPAVAVSRVDGLDQFTPLPDSILTKADKLKVYFEPLHYKVENDSKLKQPFRAKFTEDARIRRKGEKTALVKEDKLLEYEARFDAMNYRIYLVNTIGLESLTPGEYEIDIVLHDILDGQATATQTMPFRVVPSLAESVANPKPEPAETTKPAKAKKAKAGRATKRPD